MLKLIGTLIAFYISKFPHVTFRLFSLIFSFLKKKVLFFFCFAFALAGLMCVMCGVCERCWWCNERKIKSANVIYQFNSSRFVISLFCLQLQNIKCKKQTKSNLLLPVLCCVVLIFKQIFFFLSYIVSIHIYCTECHCNVIEYSRELHYYNTAQWKKEKYK